MALVDPTTEQIVVRIVYDGPAYAGKTTSLRALAGSLGSGIYCAGETDGRTLYFDWVDYLGGRFEGLPIRCQIVSVPGQQVLLRRRRKLLETADAVVFVLDSRRSALDESRRAFDLLNQVMAAAAPPFGVVVQANKRDLPDAVELDELRRELGDAPNLAMTESIAEQGTGIRETFVFAVRLALDRVRTQWSSRQMPRLAPEVASGEQLLASMQALEEDTDVSLTSVGMGAHERREAAAAGSPLAPNAPPPSADTPTPIAGAVPPGQIWPPVEGRVIVHEAMRSPAHLERRATGDWSGNSRDWRLHSAATASYTDVDQGRAALVAWARWHTAAAHRLSPQRCVVLAATTPDSDHERGQAGGSTWRLWQIVRRRRSLADDCIDLLAQADDAALGAGLVRVAEARLRAESELVAAGWLHRLDLRAVGFGPAGQPLYVGLAPLAVEPPQAPRPACADPTVILRGDLAPLLRQELALTPRRLPGVLAGLRSAASAIGRGDIAEVLQGLLLAS